MVAVADKLDTIAGMFAIDEPPTGSKDPFALRRAAIGVVNILRDRLHIGYEGIVRAALAAYAEQGIEFDMDATADAVCAFILGRMQQISRDEHVSPDVVAAVSAGNVTAPDDFFALAHALEDAREQDPEAFENLATAYARAAHLAQADLGCEVDTALAGDAERALIEAVDAAGASIDSALAAKDFTSVIAALACSTASSASSPASRTSARWPRRSNSSAGNPREPLTGYFREDFVAAAVLNARVRGYRAPHLPACDMIYKELNADLRGSGVSAPLLFRERGGVPW